MIEKNIVLLFLIIGIIELPNIFAQDLKNNGNEIIGTWLMPENEGIIEIYNKGKFYNGKIIWMQEKEKDGSLLKDKENPVDSLQSRSVVGLEVMQNFKYYEDNLWNGGTFYAAKKGKILEPEIVLANENILNIEVSFFLFSKTITLTRIDKKILETLIEK